MSHVSTNFDRTGFQQDWNIVFPLDRLQELAAKGIIGSVAAYHYSFNEWSCPVSFKNQMGEGSDLENLYADFNREVSELRPWYDLNLKKTNRTTMVAFSADSASKLLGRFGIGEAPEFSETDFSLATALRLAAQDLKAFYFEAVTARPDSSLPSIEAFNQWFWQETAAAGILKAVKERCLKETDESLRMTGALLLIPMDQQ